MGTMRHIDNGALFLAAARGYFKAEGLDLDMTAYASNSDVAQSVAAGGVDFGLAAFTTTAFNYAGRGLIKAIAGQVREKSDYEGNQILVSNAVYSRGLRKPENLKGLSAAIDQVGSLFHYQLAQVARVKGFDPASITLKPQGSLKAIVIALSEGKVDAAILPGIYARALLTGNQAKLAAWYSEIDEQQLGALFASAKVIETRRATVEKFLRAYRKGAADYYQALMRHDRYGKRISNAQTREAASAIARYVYPGRKGSGGKVEAEAYFMDPTAPLDSADIARQVEWYKAKGLVDKDIDARAVMDLSFK
ncbi:MAG: ABC transporter substrate-binding protein [Pseudolabrys sp.]|nr:ABC transporter substrate-binding protein [Pseudolabrys sp.]